MESDVKAKALKHKKIVVAEHSQQGGESISRVLKRGMKPATAARGSCEGIKRNKVGTELLLEKKYLTKWKHKIIFLQRKRQRKT